MLLLALSVLSDVVGVHRLGGHATVGADISDGVHGLVVEHLFNQFSVARVEDLLHGLSISVEVEDVALHSFHLVIKRMLLYQVITVFKYLGYIWCLIAVHAEVNVILVWLSEVISLRFRSFDLSGVIFLWNTDVPVVLSGWGFIDVKQDLYEVEAEFIIVWLVFELKREDLLDERQKTLAFLAFADLFWSKYVFEVLNA